MKRRVSTRLTALLLAVLFLLSGGREALGVGDCPHHDALPAAGHPAGEAAREDHGAGHVHGARAAADAHEPASADHGESCSCVGSCSAGVSPSLPVGTESRASDLPSRLLAVAAAGADRVLPGLSPFTLPYATAPPSSR